MNRIPLVYGQRIPMADGTLSKYVFLGRQGRRAKTKCPVCGRKFMASIQHIRNGCYKGCSQCSRRKRRTDYKEGDILQTIRRGASQWIYLSELKINNKRIIVARCQKCGWTGKVDYHQIRATGAPGFCLGCSDYKR